MDRESDDKRGFEISARKDGRRYEASGKIFSA
jgi:hypothetical protein